MIDEYPKGIKTNYSKLSKRDLLLRYERGYSQEELNKIYDEWVSRNYEQQELINARKEYQEEKKKLMEEIVVPSEYERNRSLNIGYKDKMDNFHSIRFHTNPRYPKKIYTDDAKIYELVDRNGENIKDKSLIDVERIPGKFRRTQLLKNVKDSKVKKALTGLVAAGLGASAMFMGLEPAVVVQTVQQAISSMDPSIVVNAIQSAAPSLTAVTAAFAGVLAKFAFHDRKKVDEAKKRLSYFDRGVLVDDIEKYENRNKVPKEVIDYNVRTRRCSCFR